MVLDVLSYPFKPLQLDLKVLPLKTLLLVALQLCAYARFTHCQ